MAIDDFEWEGDIEAPPSRAPSQRERASSRAALSWLKRWRQSVWLEPALRLGGMAVLLGVLAGIGVVATTYAKPGTKLPEGSRALAAALGTSWLKPTAPEASSAAPEVRAKPVGPALSAAPVALLAAPATSAAAPPAGEANETAPEAPAPSAPSGVTPDGKVVLNLASADELTKLPGVGMKRAQAIVALRAKLKRFKHATDLLRVKGIGPRGLQRMLPHLVLDAP